jgi:hypothetical protein
MKFSSGFSRFVQLVQIARRRREENPHLPIRADREIVHMIWEWSAATKFSLERLTFVQVNQGTFRSNV